MKIVIILTHCPTISEYYILEEFKLLDRSGIPFKVINLGLNVDQNGGIKFIKLGKFKQRIINLKKDLSFPNLTDINRVNIRNYLSIPVKNYFACLIFVLNNLCFDTLKYFLKSLLVVKQMRDFNSDIIYSHLGRDSGLMALFISKLTAKKFGIILHSLVPGNIDNYFPYYTGMMKEASYIIVKAPFVKKDLIKHFPFILNKVVVLPWGIDTSYFKPIQIKRQKKIFQVLSISRLAEKKGFIYLIEALNSFKQNGYQFKCDLYGNGSENEILVKLINKYDLADRVKIYSGLFHSSSFNKIISAADIFVLPSIRDTKGDMDIIPNVVLEAMAMEIPVLTTYSTCLKEYIINDINGYIVKEKDPRSLLNVLEKFIKLSIYKRKRIGVAARRTVIENFNKTDLGKKFIAFLRKQPSYISIDKANLYVVK